MEIDSARLGIEGHVNDLPGSWKAERKGKQRQRGHDENLRRLAWRPEPTGENEGHRVGLERATLSDGENGPTHTKRKRAPGYHLGKSGKAMNRRDFLGLALAAVAMPTFAKGRSNQPRTLSLHHLHTGERIKVTYRVGNRYQRKVLQTLNGFMRDFRTGEVITLDPRLFDLLYDIDRGLGYPGGPIEIFSAYRSPQTNALLRKASGRVARNSLHMQGKALDIRFSGISTARVCKSALSLNRGGVGFYPKSNFVHIDTGSVRSWRA